MKINKLLFFTIILFLILLIPNMVSAAVGDEFTNNNLKYTVLTEETNNYTVKVSGYEGNLEEVTIPQLVINNTNTYTVTEVGENAFRNNTTLKSITMPNTVTIIKMAAFEKCEKLENITLSQILNSIEEYAFCDCKALTSITIPNSVTEIKQSAFLYATSLRNVTLSNSLTTIGESAFEMCYDLENVTIPKSVTTIGPKAFAESRELKEIAVEQGNTQYCSVDGVLFNYDKTKLICYPAKKDVTTYSIPNTVKTIGIKAFVKNTLLTNIEIPNSVTTIESSAFDGCTSLTIVIIPDSITTIEQYAFCWCSNLNRINIPNSVTNIADNTVFRGCEKLTIFCNDGSYAKQYALNNSINSKPLYYYSVINELVNLNSDGNFYAHQEEGDYTATLTPTEGHVLPKNIKVKIGDDTIEYNYNTTTGKLVIPKSNITGDITIEATVYKVIFDANGGTFESNNEETLIFDDWQPEDYINLEKPTRDAYKFVGYYTEKEGGTSFDHYYNESGVDGDMILYARWEITKKFTQDSINQTFEVGTDKTLSFTLLIEDTDKENRTVYIDGEKLSMNDGDYTSQNLDSYPYITLSENYMKTLKTGTHTIKIVLKDVKEAETTFKVIEKILTETEEILETDKEEKEENIEKTPTITPTTKPITTNPQTGDNIWMFIGLLGFAVVGIITIRKYKK